MTWSAHSQSPVQKFLNPSPLPKRTSCTWQWGISGEAGETLDLIKKHIAYNKPLDYAHIVEELGDIEYYLEGLRQGLNLDRTMILEENVKKLSKRYPGLNYSDSAAVARADKA